MGNIKPFRGQVKISDIQEAFDFLLNKMNSKIARYNEILASVDDINFNRGKATLAPTGYALSIGGLKSIIKAYGTFIIGCNVFYANTNKVIVSGGVVFYTENGSVNRVVIRRQSLTGINWNTYGIYLDKNTGNLTPTKSSSTILIRPINHNRINNTNNKYRLENTMPYLVEDVGNYNFRTGDNNYYPLDAQSIPTGDLKFVSIAEEFQTDGQPQRNWYFNGTNIGYVTRVGDKLKAFIQRIWLFLPKSISNPLSYSGGQHGNTTKWFGCSVTR